jgi:hypothetical protein
MGVAMTIRKTCIVCGEEKLYQALDLGLMPSSNDLPKKDALNLVKEYELRYYMCPKCGLFQLLEVADRLDLFDNYLYLTGVNRELVAHFKELYENIGTQDSKKDFAVVVGSNDGTEVSLLKEYGKFKNVIGVEPAKNIANMANSAGRTTINDFFSLKTSQKIVEEYGKADLVVANNVFAHIPDPRDMLEGMKNLINEDGRIIIEVHWLKSIVEELEIETLYAEHYYVWTVKAMNVLSKQLGMKIIEVLYMPKQHGGSLRFTFAYSGTNDLALMENEKNAGLYEKSTMELLQKRAEDRKNKLKYLIREINKQGKRVSIWSVPAKVPTLINYCGFTDKDIGCAYEVAESKIGRYIPKANIPIKEESLIEEDKPDYLIIGAWNYMDFAIKKLKWFTDSGGKLINPLTAEIL